MGLSPGGWCPCPGAVLSGRGHGACGDPGIGRDAASAGGQGTGRKEGADLMTPGLWAGGRLAAVACSHVGRGVCHRVPGHHRGRVPSHVLANAGVFSVSSASPRHLPPGPCSKDDGPLL